jgi:hypothetical protein
MRKTLIVATGVTVALAVTASSGQAATITQMLGTAIHQRPDRRDRDLRVEPQWRPCAVRPANRRPDQRPEPLDQLYLLRLRGANRVSDCLGDTRVRPL